MLNDLRLVFRGLRKNPGFASVAILTIALGIGASTAIFTVVHGVLLRALPYPDPDSLMQVETVFSSGRSGRVSYPDFEDLREQNQSFQELAAYAHWTTSASAEGQGFRVRWAHVSDGFFPVFGVEPATGRVFSGDEQRTSRQVAVVSHGYWQSRLGASENLGGLSVRVRDQLFDVIGVMPRGYDFPPGTELWVPRQPATESRTAQNWSVVGRLRDGVSQDRSQQEMSAIGRRIKQQHGDDTFMTDAAVQPVLDQLVGQVRPALLLLLAATGVLLLVACVNVANLLLTRALARDRESSLRLALGARPRHLVRSFLLESLVLSLSGGALGALIAVTGVPALMALEPARLPRVQDVNVDWPVLVFALCSSVLAALIIGLVPAIRASRRNMREALADGCRIQGVSVGHHRLRAGLVVTQISLTIVLVVSAGLLGRSFLELLEVDPGCRTGGVLIMDVWLPEPLNEAHEKRNADFFERLTARLGATPGVEQAGGVNHFPLDGGGPNGTFIILQRPDEVVNFDDFGRLMKQQARIGNAEFRVASADYFRAMGIPLIRGRLFQARDSSEAPHVALISASLAESRWPGEDPLGKLIQFGNMDGDLQASTIVGIVGDVQEYGLGTPARPTFYVDYRQRPRTASTFHLAIQGSLDVAAMIQSARRIATQLNPEAPTAFRTLDEVFLTSLADRRFLLLLIALFGGLALVLATTGIYGVIAYLAVQRTPEMGIRMALGARAGDILLLLVGQGVKFGAAGVAIGLAAAFAVTRLLSGFLYNVSTADPVTFATTAVGIFVAAVAAGWLPAYRASRVDAVEALRHE